MKHNIYTIYDKVSETYAQPYYAINDATAVRNTADLLNRDQNLQNHADDYSLERTGVFDDQTGTIDALDKPELVVRVASLLNIKKDA